MVNETFVQQGETRRVRRDAIGIEKGHEWLWSKRNSCGQEAYTM